MKLKQIQAVPQSSHLIDIVLNTTQRKTPTVIHAHFAIPRIRSFYMKKVKMTTNEFCARLATILSQFPVVENIPPFYADLLNVLYDKDHYKMALGHVNAVNKVIKKVGAEFLKLLKFGDSLYRCKQLKKACLGKMASTAKKLKSSLEYLEEVRQHMSRLPTVELTMPTIILCGHPNVGKSSFMNKITRANVDVQPYAFTTKNIFVGHFERGGVKYQVIDTPGLLDHEVEDRNTIEMQSIVALVHLNAKTLFFIDPSGQCGYSITQQVALFHSLNVLMKNSIIVLSKSDLRAELGEESDLMENFIAGKNVVDVSVRDDKNVEYLLDLICGPGLDKEEIEMYGVKTNPKEVAVAMVDVKPIDFIIPEIINGKNIMDMVDAKVNSDFIIEREYDLLDKETVALKEQIDNERRQRVKNSVFKKRASIPENWKNRVAREPFVREVVIRDKKQKPEKLKKIEKIIDKRPKHLFRGKSKHGRG